MPSGASPRHLRPPDQLAANKCNKRRRWRKARQLCFLYACRGLCVAVFLRLDVCVCVCDMCTQRCSLEERGSGERRKKDGNADFLSTNYPATVPTNCQGSRAHLMSLNILQHEATAGECAGGRGQNKGGHLGCALKSFQW